MDKEFHPTIEDDNDFDQVSDLNKLVSDLESSKTVNLPRDQNQSIY